MSISTIRSAPHVPGAGMRGPGATKNAPSPQPAPPSPLPPDPQPPVDVDFSHIDTPEKAALLPALNPAAIAAVAAAVLASSDLTPVAVDFHFGATTPGAIQYRLVSDLNTPPQQKPLPMVKTSGELGGAVPFQEKWRIEGENTLHISGSIGNCQEELTIKADDDEKVMQLFKSITNGGAKHTPTKAGHKEMVAHLDGKIGDIEVHQTISEGGTDEKPSILADGTLGGMAFHQEVTPEVYKTDSPRVLVHGNLGDKPIQTTTSATHSADTMIIHGEGTIAGTDFKLDCTSSI